MVTPVRPDLVVLVPDRAGSRWGDSGFDLSVGAGAVAEAAAALAEAGLDVLALVAPDREQVTAAHRLGLRGGSFVGSRLSRARAPCSPGVAAAGIAAGP